MRTGDNRDQITQDFRQRGASLRSCRLATPGTQHPHSWPFPSLPNPGLRAKPEAQPSVEKTFTSLSLSASPVDLQILKTKCGPCHSERKKLIVSALRSPIQARACERGLPILGACHSALTTRSQLRGAESCLGEEAGTVFGSPDKVLILSLRTQQGGPKTRSR